MSDQPTPHVFTRIRGALTVIGSGLVRLGPALNGVFRVTRQILEFGKRWILRILLVGLFLLPTVAILGLLFSGAWTPDVHVAATALWVALSVAIAGGIWAILWMLPRLFLRLVRSSSLGTGMVPRLIALLIVFALFPTILTPTIVGIAWSVVQVGLATPINLIRLSGSALQDPGLAEGAGQAPPAASGSLERFDDTVVIVIFERFIRAVDRTVSPVVGALPERVPLNELAVAVVTWFLLALLGREALSYGIVSRALPAMRAVAVRLGELLRFTGASISQYPSLNWSNIGFLLILTMGTFLSMAAITSLPRLRESPQPNSDVNADSLRRDLTELQLSEAQIASYYGEDTPAEIVVLQSVLPGAAQTQAGESVNTAGPSTPGASKPGEGRATESEAAAKKTEPAANDASKRGPKPSTEMRDGARNSTVAAEDATKASKGEESDSASTLAAAKAKLEAARADLERARTEYFGSDWSDASKRLVLQSQLNSAHSREQAASDEMELASEHLRLVALVEEQGNTLRASWSGLVLRSQSLKEFIRSDESQSLSSAVREYSVQNIERRGSREEIAHFLRIRGWYAEKINSHRNALRLCGEQLRSGRSTGATWMSAMRRTLVRADTLSDAYRRPIEVLEQGSATNRLLTRDVCEIPSAAPIPGPPPLGDSLGPLRFIAGWLLNAASLPLALIVGLVGFGLLGAAISTFVREQLEARLMPVPPKERHVIVSDLAGVALRGISAAIVVFLAVQGGLAVLSGASSDPNPYVLLLACFVAAVFSERVWRRAYDYLQVQLAPDDEPKPTREKPLSIPPASKPEE